MPGIEMEHDFQKMLDEWERELYMRNMRRMYKTSKNYQDPRKKAFEDYRHHHATKWIYAHECKFIKKMTNRKLRRKMKSQIYNKVYAKIIPYDYKTYGWLTW